LDHIAVVGASLAGLRAAETLRAEGFTGRLSIVGDEPHRPYDRPPLSKQVLTGEWDAERIALPVGAPGRLDAGWLLGRAAVRLDAAARRVTLDDGTVLDADGIVIATGASPRLLPGTDGVAGVHVLRTVDDATALAGALDGARSAVVVGAGFIGSEVAASCRARGVEVVLVEPLPQPLARVLGERVGSVVADLHRRHGVDVRLGVGVEAVTTGATGRPRVTLADGSVLDAEVVVVGIGVIPNTAWLADSGLALDDGVLCDETTLAAPGIVAAGDVARWPNRRFDEVMRVEHWEHALDMAAHAARRLLAEAAGEPGEAYEPVPWFWSDQYDRKIQLAGRPHPDDELAVVAGDLDGDRFCALYGRDGRATAVLGINLAGRVVRYRRALADGLAWDQVLADAEANAAAAPGGA